MNDNKDVKREIFLYSVADYYSLKEYFEDMARKGWLINRIKWNIATYKRIQPTDLTFSVAVYPGLSVTDVADKDEVESYKNLYKDAGWSYAISLGNLHIFYSKTEDKLLPIQTYEEINKMILEKSIYPEAFGLAFWIFAVLLNIMVHFPYEYDDLFSNMGLVFPLFWPLVLIDTLIGQGGDILWYIKVKRNIKLNNTIHNANFRKTKTIRSVSFIFSLILIMVVFIAVILDSVKNPGRIIWFILPIIAVFAISYTYKNEIIKLNISRVSKGILVIVIIIIIYMIAIFTGAVIGGNSDDKKLEPGHMGFTSEDFDINSEPEHISFESEGSILVPVYFNYRESSRKILLETTYVETREEKIAKYVFDGIVADETSITRRYNKILSDASNEYTGYDEAYYLGYPDDEIKKSSLILLKDNKILFLETDFDLSEDKYINIITNKIRDGII